MEVEELPAAAKMVGEVTEVLEEEESVEETEAKEAENTDKMEEKERGDEGGEEEEQSGAKKRKGLWESGVRTCVEVDCWEVVEGQQP